MLTAALLILVCPGTACLAQNHSFLSGFYLKPTFGLQMNANEHSNIQIGSGGFGVAQRSSNREATYFAAGSNYALLIGYDFPSVPIFVEAGVGQYHLALRNELTEVNWSSEFAPIINRLRYDQLSASVGYRFKVSKRLTIAPTLGIRLVEIQYRQHPNLSGSAYPESGTFPDSLHYNISFSHVSINTNILIRTGLQASYLLSSKLAIQAEGFWEHGYRSLQTAGTYIDYYTDQYQNEESNITLNKGESFGLNVSLKWNIFRKPG